MKIKLLPDKTAPCRR